MKIPKATWSQLILFAFFAQPLLAANAPFSLRIALLHNRVRSGYVQLTATITNTTNHEIFLNERNQCDYSVDVRDESGKSTPATPLKQELQCSGAPFSMTGRNIIVALKPQQSTSEEISVSELFDLTKPDEYTIQVSRSVSDNKKDGVVKSNKTTVTVIP